MWQRGLSYTDIAKNVGLTRERVRQRLLRNGVSGVNRNPRPVNLDLLAEAQNYCSLKEIASVNRLRPEDLQHAISEAGLGQEIDTILELNRRAKEEAALEARRNHLIAQIRELAAAVGHTPTSSDLKTKNIFLTQLHREFGGTDHAMRRAGLQPNRPGYPPMSLPPWFRSS